MAPNLKLLLRRKGAWLPILLVLAAACLLLFSSPQEQPVLAQSDTRSPAEGSDCREIDFSSGSAAWAGPEWAAGDDDRHATVSVDGSASHYLYCRNLGFRIPSGSTINGIGVSFKRGASSTANGGSRDASVMLVDEGSRIVGLDRSTLTVYPLEASYEDHGGPGDLWGLAWTTAQVNDPDFGVVIAVSKPDSNGEAHTVSIDHVRITVHYTLPALDAPAAGEPWCDCDYGFRKEITIDSTKVAADQTDFPVLISFAADADLAANAQDDGDDLFFTASDGMTRLKHELESFNGATGELKAWVKVPALSSIADTVIFLYYGNGAVGSQADPPNVWDGNFAAVWHMKEDPSGGAPQILDSTANDNDASSQGGMTDTDQVSAKIDGGLDFDAIDDHLNVPDSASLRLTNAITLEAWVRPRNPNTSWPGIVSRKQESDNTCGYTLQKGNNNDWRFYGYIDSGWRRAAAPLNSVVADVFQYVVGTYDGSTLRIYKDGVEVGTLPYAGTICDPGAVIARLARNDDSGGGGSDHYFNAVIDEVRISSIARSPAWITTAYNNSNDPAGFLKSIGSQEVEACTPTPTATPTDTLTPTATESSTATPTETSTPTDTPTATNTPTQTNTPTSTATNTATQTSTPTSTATSTASSTATPTATSTSSAPPCPGCKMYWTEDGTDKIQRSNLDGSNIEDLVTSGLSIVRGIALDLDGGKMYWVDSGTQKIQRANLDGSGVEDLVSGLNTPRDIALDVAAGKMYWTDTGADVIRRANLDGSAVEDLVSAGLSAPIGIALDLGAGKMYWVDNLANRVQRANLDGSSVEDLVVGAVGPRSIALDLTAGKMYWSITTGNKIQRANLDGSAVEDVITAGLSAPRGIALDVNAGKMYWIDNGSGRVLRANMDGSGLEELVTGLVNPNDIALDLEPDPATPTPTETVGASPTATSTNTPTATSTASATSTSTATPTATSSSTSTPTPTATSSSTPTPTASNTSTPSSTPTASATPNASATAAVIDTGGRPSVQGSRTRPWRLVSLSPPGTGWQLNLAASFLVEGIRTIHVRHLEVRVADLTLPAESGDLVLTDFTPLSATDQVLMARRSGLPGAGWFELTPEFRLTLASAGQQSRLHAILIATHISGP